MESERKPKRLEPLVPSVRAALARLVADRGGANPLARAWRCGQPTVVRAVRGVPLTHALAAYLTARVLGEAPTLGSEERAAA